MALKMAVLAPMPTASVSTATKTNVGCRRSVRSAYRKTDMPPIVYEALADFFGVFALVSLAAFAAVLRASTVCAPNFLVNRSTRPSVSISFCRPVKNGWQLEQISRWRSLRVERVFHEAPQAQWTV